MKNNYLRSFWYFLITLTLLLICMSEKVMSEPAKEWMDESCNEAEIEKLRRESHAKLPPKIRNILNRDYHGWFFSKNCIRPYPLNLENPHLIFGDFDSNGDTDCVVLIGHLDKWSLLAFLKKANEFKIHILRTGHDDDTPYINIQLIFYKKGETDTYPYDAEMSSFVYPHDSFKFWWGTTEDAYVFERGYFKVLDMGD